MLARNPKTGGTIRLMRSNSSVWKNRKTLVWMKEPPSENGGRWKRWDIAIEGVDPKLLLWDPQLVVLRDDSPEVHAWLGTPEAKDVRFILISSKIVESIGEEIFGGFGLGNVLCLEEFSVMYPFIGPDWNGTMEDALVSASIVFRYQRLIGVKGGHSRLSEALLKPIKLELLEVADLPEPLVLIQQYYKPPQQSRAKELEKCLIKNLDNPLIDTIYLFVESKDIKLPQHRNNDKLVLIHKKSRITYADCIEFIQNKIGKGSLVAFANADIYLDDSWSSLWSVDLHDIFFALLRWEEHGNNGQGPPELFSQNGPRSDSQDTWVIHSDSVVERRWNLDPFRIQFGTAGCDNAILVEFLRNKFRIVNPAMSLRTLHVHASQIRNYDPKDIVDRPVYMHVDPNGIHELNPVTIWDEWTNDALNYKPLDRPLKATTSKMLNMFCSQINRDTSFAWTADGANSYVTPANQDHQIKIADGAFVSCNGLTYKHTDLCVGSTDIQKELWSDNKISHLMPAQMTHTMMCFPLETEWLNRPALYTLYYLSRVIKQHHETPEASFWCKQSADLLPAFKLFNWQSPRGRLIHYSEQTQVFANTVVGRTAHSVRLMPTDIDSLRDNVFGGWTKEANDKVIVIVSDELHIKDDLLKSLETYLEGKGYEIRVIYSKADAENWANALCGAGRVILSSSVKNLKYDTWAWMWLAPVGCKLLELQEEREPCDSLVHLAAAASLDWTLLQYPRSTPEGFKKIVMKEVDKWFQTELAASLPLVLTPPKSMKFGFFGHKGDSFRELIDMWAEKGYVEHKEDPILTQCWLGGVGKVLLYDRPTWSWLEKSGESEQSYKVCLAGNPPASEKAGAQSWIFWPRQPRLVEKLAADVDEFGYNERVDSLVFYGRVENDTQGKFRQDIDSWKSICSKFSMPIGAKEPYLLGPEEYLMALKKAKYGLCLRGFGQKCNREIELLAMGAVPIVTPGVDISGYAEPLLDGIHVICVTDAADAKKRMAAITPSEWNTMSRAGRMWWKRNASVDGSWARTKVHLI